MPLKVLAWQDETGVTWVAYNNPVSIARHGVDPALEARAAATGTGLHVLALAAIEP